MFVYIEYKGNQWISSINYGSGRGDGKPASKAQINLRIFVNYDMCLKAMVQYRSVVIFIISRAS